LEFLSLRDHGIPYVDGIAYVTLNDSDAWKYGLLHELRQAGFDAEL
jgi:hypothetical protein